MRLWSLHPSYLDSKGLVAVWREALLAKRVLQNMTKGYKAHPQLIRFRNQTEPINSINAYLKEILTESQRRGYRFDINKIEPVKTIEHIAVSSGQIQYEFRHLLRKLRERDPVQFNKIKNEKRIKTHPLFQIVPGIVEKWEKT